MTAVCASRGEPHAAAWSTLVELLEHRGKHQGHEHAFVFLENGTVEAARVTFGELAERARRVGAELQRRGALGERVVLLYPSGLDFIAAFFGCLYAGATPVPVPAGMSRSRARLEAIASDARPKFVLTPPVLVSAVRRRLRGAPVMTILGTDEALAGPPTDWRPAAIDGDTLALLQYTSGSTDSAKGVMVTHANILHNQRLIMEKFEHSKSSVMLSWLPVFHDMGLIGKIVQPVYVGCPGILMSPESFLQEPGRWLRAITRYRATTSGAPNFAFDMCVDRIPLADRAQLDLRSWQVAFNGAEPIRSSTLERFVAAFGPCGFRREAFYPCYGLAEATLLTTGGTRSEPPVLLGNAVGCGRSGDDQRVLIVDPASRRPAADGEVGEIWVAGPSVARGYWGRPEETRDAFGARLAGTDEGPFLRTGDLGFLADGELFVTGRIKEVMIVRGRNHYPQDVERTAEESHPALRRRGGAAFLLDADGRSRLVLAHEVQPEHAAEPPTAEIARRVRAAVAREHGLYVAVLVLLKAGSLPRTSSGKIQRRLCQAHYQGGTLALIAADGHGSSAGPATTSASVPSLTPQEKSP